jgi:hypothetical protein
MRTGSVRTEAEERVRELRRLLTTLTRRLEEFRAGPTSEWRERSVPTRAASSDLAHALDAVSDMFD